VGYGLPSELDPWPGRGLERPCGQMVHIKNPILHDTAPWDMRGNL
ncbi:442_t:CDS:2, partial [Paraglomus brasilianum]